MKYVLFHPEAYELLSGGDIEAFRESWLKPSLAHFSSVLQQRPSDPKLLHIEQEILRRPMVRRAYEATPEWITQSGDIHVNSSSRPIRDPRTGELAQAHVVRSHQGYQPLSLTVVTWVIVR